MHASEDDGSSIDSTTSPPTRPTALFCTRKLSYTVYSTVAVIS